MQGRLISVVIGTFAIFAAQGCESEESCVVGRAVPCACTDGRSGAQMCLPDLTYGPCVCTSSGMDGGGFDGGDFDAGPLSDGGEVDVERLMPTGDRVYVRDTLMIQARVRSGAADRVEIHIDGELLVELVPPYSYVWDTRTEDEREYVLTIHAFFGAREAVTPPLTVVVDRTPPSVVERTPVEGTRNVWLWDPITLRMSEPVLASTVTESSIVVSGMGSASIRKTTTLAADEMSFEIELESRPTLPSDVTVEVTPAITDYAGNPAVRDSWSFNAPEWSSVPIDFGTPDVQLLGLEAHAHDSIFVTGRPTPGTGFYVAEWDGARWQSLGGLLGPRTQAGPTLCASDDGNVFVAWSAYNSDGTVLTLYAARWDGTTWLETDVATGSYGDLLLACEGSTVTLMGGYFGPPHFIDFWRWDGAAWDALESGPVSSDARATPTFAATAGGELFVADSGFPGSAYRYDGAWRTEPSPGNFVAPTLAYGDAGDLFLGARFEGSYHGIRRLVGGEWRPLVSETTVYVANTVVLEGGRVVWSYGRRVPPATVVELIDADTMASTTIGTWTDASAGGTALFDTSDGRDLYRAQHYAVSTRVDRWNGR